MCFWPRCCGDLFNIVYMTKSTSANGFLNNIKWTTSSITQSFLNTIADNEERLAREAMERFGFENINQVFNLTLGEVYMSDEDLERMQSEVFQTHKSIRYPIPPSYRSHVTDPNFDIDRFKSGDWPLSAPLPVVEYELPEFLQGKYFDGPKIKRGDISRSEDTPYFPMIARLNINIDPSAPRRTTRKSDGSIRTGQRLYDEFEKIKRFRNENNLPLFRNADVNTLNNHISPRPGYPGLSVEQSRFSEAVFFYYNDINNYEITPVYEYLRNSNHFNTAGITWCFYHPGFNRGYRGDTPKFSINSGFDFANEYRNEGNFIINNPLLESDGTEFFLWNKTPNKIPVLFTPEYGGSAYEVPNPSAQPAPRYVWKDNENYVTRPDSLDVELSTQCYATTVPVPGTNFFGIYSVLKIVDRVYFNIRVVDEENNVITEYSDFYYESPFYIEKRTPYQAFFEPGGTLRTHINEYEYVKFIDIPLRIRRSVRFRAIWGFLLDEDFNFIPREFERWGVNPNRLVRLASEVIPISNYIRRFRDDNGNPLEVTLDNPRYRFHYNTSDDTILKVANIGDVIEEHPGIVTFTPPDIVFDYTPPRYSDPTGGDDDGTRTVNVSAGRSIRVAPFYDFIKYVQYPFSVIEADTSIQGNIPYCAYSDGKLHLGVIRHETVLNGLARDSERIVAHRKIVEANSPTSVNENTAIIETVQLGNHGVLVEDIRVIVKDNELLRVTESKVNRLYTTAEYHDISWPLSNRLISTPTRFLHQPYTVRPTSLRNLQSISRLVYGGSGDSDDANDLFYSVSRPLLSAGVVSRTEFIVNNEQSLFSLFENENWLKQIYSDRDRHTQGNFLGRHATYLLQGKIRRKPIDFRGNIFQIGNELLIRTSARGIPENSSGTTQLNHTMKLNLLSLQDGFYSSGNRTVFFADNVIMNRFRYNNVAFALGKSSTQSYNMTNNSLVEYSLPVSERVISASVQPDGLVLIQSTNAPNFANLSKNITTSEAQEIINFIQENGLVSYMTLFDPFSEQVIWSFKFPGNIGAPISRFAGYAISAVYDKINNFIPIEQLRFPNYANRSSNWFTHHRIGNNYNFYKGLKNQYPQIYTSNFSTVFSDESVFVSQIPGSFFSQETVAPHHVLRLSNGDDVLTVVPQKHFSHSISTFMGRRYGNMVQSHPESVDVPRIPESTSKIMLDSYYLHGYSYRLENLDIFSAVEDVEFGSELGLDPIISVTVTQN